MKTNEMFPSSYLKATDLKGKPVKLVIKGCKMEDLGDDRKPVLTFKGTDKKLALNITNKNLIEEVLHSDETDDWNDKTIVLVPAKTEFQGKRVDCIRVSDDPRHYNGSTQKLAPPPVEDFGDDSEAVPF